MGDDASVNDLAPATPVDDEAVGDEAVGDEAAEGRTGDAAPRLRRRSVAFTLGRAVLVLAAAGITYQFVVPVHDVVRGRLARLVVSKPGLPAFAKTHPQTGQPDDTQTGLSTVTAAAKKSPDHAGVYSIEWSPSQTSGAAVIAFLLPSDSAASSTLGEIRSHQLASGAYSSNSMSRTSTFAVAGVPGSHGSVFSPDAKAPKGTPTLSVVALQAGRLVAVEEVIGTSSNAKPWSQQLASAEYAHLRGAEPGFTLSVTRYPLVATIVWAAGAVVLAAIAALAPLLWARRRDKRRRQWEEEMASQVVVGGKLIVKHRR